MKESTPALRPAGIAPRFAVRASTTYSVGDATNIKWHEGSVSRETRQELLGQKGCVLWFTGLSGSSAPTIPSLPARARPTQHQVA